MYSKKYALLQAELAILKVLRAYQTQVLIHGEHSIEAVSAQQTMNYVCQAFDEVLDNHSFSSAVKDLYAHFDLGEAA